MTDAQRRALEILWDHPGIETEAFARLMWPDSPFWKRHYKCGVKGSRRGLGVVRSAGGFLGKLERTGLITRTRQRHSYASGKIYSGLAQHRLSAKGRETLCAAKFFEAGREASQ